MSYSCNSMLPARAVIKASFLETVAARMWKFPSLRFQYAPHQTVQHLSPALRFTLWRVATPRSPVKKVTRWKDPLLQYAV